MKPEKEHTETALMCRTKKELVDRIRMLEYNNNVLHDTLDTQSANYIKLTSWIPVSERLPEETGFTLVSRLFAGEIVVSLMYYSEEHRQWETFSTRGEDGIIAWMPFPEGYKPEEKSV